MKRAVDLFTLERRWSFSPFVEETWWTRSAPEASFISVAASHWEMVVTRRCGTAGLTVRGPETEATIVPIPEDAEFFGIQFRLGTFMPSLPPGWLVDSSLALPQVTSSSFWLDGSAWELPGPANTDVFVDRLVRAGLLVHDPIASAALRGEVNGLSPRTVERRVSRATGLTQGAIRQIRRAERRPNCSPRACPRSTWHSRSGTPTRPIWPDPSSVSWARRRPRLRPPRLAGSCRFRSRRCGSLGATTR